MSENLLSIVQKSADIHKDKVAVSFYKCDRWFSHSYREVMHNATVFGSHMKSLLGDTKKQFIALHLDVTQTFPSIILGILHIGHAFVPLGLLFSPLSNNWLLDKLSVLVIVSNTDSLYLDKGNFNWTKSEPFYLLGEELYIWKKGVSANKQECASEIVYAIQTSGSTGIPKIVQVPHCSIVPNVLDLSNLFGITSKDVIYFGSPITFDPSVVELFLALGNGAVLCIVEKSIRQDATRLIDIIFPLDSPVVTFLQTTPSLFKRWPLTLMKSRIFKSVTKFRLLILGGEPFPEDDLLSWNVPDNIRLFNLYGITEVSCWASVRLVEGCKKPIDIGRPLLDTQLSIRNCDSEEIGEMFIGSEKRICIVNEESYSQLSSTKPIFRSTGDLFKVEGGAYYFIGRKDHVIKKWGIKINLNEIEKTASQHQSVSLAACVSSEKENILKVGLFIVPNEGFNVDLFRIFLLDNLPKGSMPDLIKILDELPLNYHGKEDRIKLKSFLKMKDCSYKNPVLQFLSLWDHYTKSTVPKSSDAFLNSGGDSFTALQLTSEFESCFNDSPKVLLELLLNNSPLHVCCSVIMSHFGHGRFLSCDLGISKYNAIVSELLNYTAIEKTKKIKTEPSQCVSGYTDEFCYQNEKEVSSVIQIKCKGRTALFEISEENIDKQSNGKTKVILEEKWKFFLGKCVDASPLGIHYKNGKAIVIIGSHSGKIVAIDANIGNIVSQCQLPNRIESTACISICGQCYFVGCYDGCMYKINIQDGKVIWKFFTADIIKSSAVTYKDFVIFGSYDKFLYCVRHTDGFLIWKTELGGLILASPQVENEIVYSSTLRGSVVALNTSNGSILWEWLSSPIFSDPLVLETSIIIADVKGNLFWLSKNSGTKIMSYAADGMIFSSLSTYKMNSNTCILFGCQDGNIYTIHEGKLKWKSTLDSRIVASPFAFMAKGKALVVSVSITGTVYILNYDDGSILFKYCLKKEVFSSPIVINNNIVFGCRDDNVYFLNLLSQIN